MTSSTVQIITKICRHLVCLVQVWIIADYLQIPRLQNYVVDTIEQIRVDSAVLTFHCLAEVYHKLPREAAVRELVFEQSIRFLTPEIYEANDCEKWLPRQFLLDHIIADKRSKGKQAQLDPFIDRAEFKRRFHVPEGI